VTTTLQQPTSSTPNKTHSSFLLLPGLIGFFFAFRTCLTFLWFQEDPQQGSIAAVALSLAILTTAALSTIGSTPSISTSAFRTPALRWIVAFLGLNLLSLLWTAAPLDAAASYWGAWAADVATIWFLLRDGHADSRAEAVMKGYISGACLVAIIAWCLPVMSDLRLGNEDYLHPNAIGFVTAIATLMAMHLAHRQKNWRWPAIWLALTLMRTISKTSIIAFFAALIFYVFRNKSLTRAARIWIGVVAGVILGVLSGLLITYANTYSESTNPETLTGRTVIWAAASEIALEKPIIGHGFYSLRFLVPPIGIFQPEQAHNELLQQFFVLGTTGVVVTLCLYWVVFRQIRRAPPSNLKTLAATLLVFALVRGLADTSNFDLSYPLWLMAMLSILLAAQTSKPLPTATPEAHAS
jgi:O-antigen ligase